MKLIYPLGNAVILDEGGRNRIAWEVDRRSIRCYQFIAAEQVAVSAGRIKVIENRTEHFGWDLSATLRDRRRGDIQSCGVNDFS